MKHSVLFLILLVIGCNTKLDPFPVKHHQTIDGRPYIVGKINRENLLQYEHSSWFLSEYEKFKVPKDWVKKNSSLLNKMTLKLFLGTWCEDSEREVPGMLKLIDYSGFNYDKLQMFAVSEDKHTPENYEKGLNITNVPTLIFYLNGKEINRFVEFPIVSLTKDLEDIIQGKSYQNPYFQIDINE